MTKINVHIRFQLIGWSIYWLLLLIINTFFFKNKDYGIGLVILWTILFTFCGLLIFFVLTKFFDYLISKKTGNVYAIIFIIISSCIGAYAWGLFEPIISWIINPKIMHLNIAWDINSRGTFPLTFVVAFFSILYYFSKLIEIAKVNTESSIIKEENTGLNDTIPVYLKNNIVMLPVQSIMKISIDGNYSRILDHKNIKYEVKKPLVKWEKELPKHTFIRIHRSTIVNKNYIEKIEPWHNYTYKIRLIHSDIPEEVSRRYAVLLKKELNL